ncbi:MAG: hypothetical protein WC575_01855 [Patescibacteria group bacterium]
MLGFEKKQESLNESQPIASMGVVKPLGEIHTMPGVSATADSTNNTNQPKKIPWLVIVTGIVVIIAIGAAVYYFIFFNKNEPTTTPEPTAPIVENEEQSPTVPEPPQEPEIQVILTPKERDQQRYMDINVIKTGLELYYSERGSYPIKITQVTLGSTSASTLSAAGFSDYPQAPLYLSKVPQDPLVDQGSVYTYSSTAGIDYQLTFSLEQGISNLSSGIHFLTSTGFDGATQPPTNEPEPETELPTVAPPLSFDGDSDGLTDVEEVIYGSLIDNPDSDDDGYQDGSEVKSGYNPVAGESVKLEESGLTQRYANVIYNYSILYPTTWQLKSSDELSSEVIFTGESGEFAQVVVQDNPEQKTALEWYSSYVPSLPPEEIPVIQIGALTAVRSLDTLNIYLAVNGKLITISYNNGTNSTADYLATFQMMYQSFNVTAVAAE